MAAFCTGLINYFCFCIGSSIVGYDSGVNNKEFIMTKPLYIIDAFTEQPFSGNPAAVCLVGPEADLVWMQQVASEMNLSETAFLSPIASDIWSLRWFTPTIEINLCGHATLASAHVLWHELSDTSALLTFRTRSGDLTAAKEGDAIRLDFPSVPVRETGLLPAFGQAIGVQPRSALRSAEDLLLVLDDAEAVSQLKPDLEKIAALAPRGVIVTALGQGTEWDFVSRFFGPASGVPEDPVTGSAHCCLGPYWAKVLGKTELAGFQASPRGGKVGVRLAGDRVHLIGRARTVLKGEFYA
jgi:predicted PhzF superfamily epimerase YddE/YHI9